MRFAFLHLVGEANLLEETITYAKVVLLRMSNHGSFFNDT